MRNRPSALWIRGMHERHGEVDITNPDYQLHAAVFNAITRHPDIGLLFSRRRRVADRTVAYIWKQVAREERRVRWYRFKWKVRQWLK